MSFRDSLKNSLVSHLFRSSNCKCKKCSCSRKRSNRVVLESLEDRQLLATFTVVNDADAGPGSLRQAILDAAGNTEADLITFSSTLSGADIELTTSVASPGWNDSAINITDDNITIDGFNAPGVTITQTGGDKRIFFVDEAATLSLRNLSVTGGDTPEYAGGIAVEGNLFLTDVIMRDNQTGSNDSSGCGGAVCSDDGNVVAIRTTFTENYSGCCGGALSNASSGTMTLIDSTVHDNEADCCGGGLCNDDGTVFVEGSTFSDNTSECCGGGLCDYDGDVQISNSTFSGNEAESYCGGGLCLDSDSDNDPSTLTNVTITDNTAECCGGLCDSVPSSHKMTVNNSIIYGNTSTDSSYPDDVYGGRVDPSSSNNLIGDHSNFPAGSIVSQADPVFAALADNGGHTKTHAILSASPAVDAGSNGKAVDTDGDPLSNDQRGFSRIAGSNVDLGAYEFEPIPSLTIDDVSMLETDLSTTNILVPATLSQALTSDLYVFFSVAPGDATPGEDYTTLNGAFTIPAGETSATFPITIVGDHDAEPDETLTVSINSLFSPGHSVSVRDSRAVVTILNDDEVDEVPPTPGLFQAVGVKVSSTDWTPEFKGFVDPTGDGFGYPIPIGTGQLDPLPWSNINQIQLKFSEDLGAIDPSQFGLAGFHTPDYGPNISSVTYDASNFTVLMELDTFLGDDQLLLVASEGITTQTGNLFDGEWTTQQTATQSGDGTAGGDFEFRFDVLPGDIDQSGDIGDDDVAAAGAALFDEIGDSDYSAFTDINGNGEIQFRDLLFPHVRRSTELPKGDPVSPFTSPGIRAAVLADISDDQLEGVLDDLVG